MQNDLGPVISKGQFDKVQEYIDIGRKEGATLLAGGHIPEESDEGYFIEPNIL